MIKILKYKSINDEMVILQNEEKTKCFIGDVVVVMDERKLKELSVLNLGENKLIEFDIGDLDTFLHTMEGSKYWLKFKIEII